MDSGTINIRGRKLSIEWTGQFAEHIAVEHIDNKHIHTYLHISAQQHAAKGAYAKTKRGHVIISNCEYGFCYVFLIVRSKFVLIRSCYVENHKNLATAKKSKGVVSGVGKNKKEKYNDVHFSVDTLQAAANVGVSEQEMKKITLDFVNGKLNTKKR